MQTIVILFAAVLLFDALTVTALVRRGRRRGRRSARPVQVAGRVR